MKSVFCLIFTEREPILAIGSLSYIGDTAVLPKIFGQQKEGIFMDLTEQLQQLQQWVDESERIVFFGGAGVSTESGIKDFRSADGLYHQKYAYPPETILSHTFYERHTEEFFAFYRDKMLCPEAEPNAAHRTLAALEQKGKLYAVITQNIDGLHQAAGSKRVYELHGSTLRNYCERCGTFYEQDAVRLSTGVPHCSCGGRIKPDVVLYEEALNEAVMQDSVAAIAEADMLIIGGTSLAVYPAAGLVQFYRGDRLVLINRDATPYDSHADLVIHDAIGKVLGGLRV